MGIVKNKKQENKTGICEVHFYNNNDNKKRKVKLLPQCRLWVCDECDDVVLIAMATINKKQAIKNNKH